MRADLRPPGGSRFRVREGQLTLDVRLGQATRRALVDTGAKGVTIDPEIAGGLERMSRTYVRGVLGRIRTVRVMLPTLVFLHRRFTGLSAKVGPPSRRSHRPFDLILGTDVLLRRPLVLDFQRKVASFEPRGKAAPAEEVHRLKYQRARPFLTARLGSRKLRATLDTGCTDCLLNARVRGIRGRKVKTDTAVDASGQRSRWTSYRGPSLDLGRGPLGVYPFLPAPLELAEKGLGQPVDFVVGLSVLRGRGGVWTISREPPELRWSRRAGG